MLIFLMYMFAVLGVSLLLAAAVLKCRLSYPSSNLTRLARAVGSFNLNFPRRFVTPDQSHIIALDEAGRTLAIGSCNPGKAEHATAQLYTFDTILGSEIIENALTLTKVSKTCRITSSANKNGDRSGRPDTVINSVHSTDAIQADEEEVKELTLKIYLSSADTPVLSIPFLPGIAPARKSDREYTLAFSEVQHVHEAIREIVSA
ncbi:MULTISPECIES: hypothetical protein [unclassified Paenibacillus]|uniref:hypothetical protein n=1 Tax=unclassified Paenibacillus TaxID=185978 RepID=UPI00240569BC|nr:MULTISPECIES: hypothetical protein [unclassified Paenibacillus]MDF9842138.1 hypothetical protein [Paenibacillus sp. PastF-2]MDF9848608.1 hypothetical protein [Paenibacillus sp. PastM-2]MDF9855177.1 hypothetical protein [Paenibacillus sp. PastF-1]MDH6480447.1 hypothetical protein [Paenibacillus sp. PastH-2]MDH6507875.1 hypothetical protein [Paenibacillus sp. PastM-3]